MIELHGPLREIFVLTKDLLTERDPDALLRRIAVNVVRQDTSKGSIRKKRKRAAWNDDALLSILTAAG